MTNVNPAMEGGKEFKPLKFKLGRPGDIVKGTLVNKVYQQPQDGDPYWEVDVKVEICQFHDLKADEAGNYIAAETPTVIDPGQSIKVYGGRKEIDELLANSKVGEIVGIQFVEFKKGKGPKPFKVVLCKNFGVDPNFKDTVQQAQEVFSGATDATEASDEKVEGVNF